MERAEITDSWLERVNALIGDSRRLLRDYRRNPERVDAGSFVRMVEIIFKALEDLRPRSMHRNFKDTVFTALFRERQYLEQLLEAVGYKNIRKRNVRIVTL